MLPKRAALLPTGEIMAGLTNRKLQSLKPAEAGKHYDIWDRDGFGVRISDKGTKSFRLNGALCG